MKNILMLSLIFFLISEKLISQNELPYEIGEHLFFNISFSGINVGSAELKIKDSISINNTLTYHIIGQGKTNLFFDFFFKVRDVYETYLDISSIVPVKFIRDINEGGYIKKQNYSFSHFDTLVQANGQAYKITKSSQDMLSAFYFARTFDKKNLKINDSFFVPIFMDEENYVLEITYLNDEILETKKGKINCMVFKPKMQEGRVFQDGETMRIWITKDDNHLLMKVETKIWAGTIEAIISDYSGIKKPIKYIY